MLNTNSEAHALGLKLQKLFEGLDVEAEDDEQQVDRMKNVLEKCERFVEMVMEDTSDLMEIEGKKFDLAIEELKEIAEKTDELAHMKDDIDDLVERAMKLLGA